MEKISISLVFAALISRIAGTNIVSAYTPIAEMEERIIIIIILQADNGIACIAQSVQFVDLCAQCTLHTYITTSK
jgi:hypothetical protein